MCWFCLGTLVLFDLEVECVGFKLGVSVLNVFGMLSVLGLLSALGLLGWFGALGLLGVFCL